MSSAVKNWPTLWGLRDFIKINSNVMVINVAVCELYVYIMHDV